MGSPFTQVVAWAYLPSFSGDPIHRTIAVHDPAWTRPGTVPFGCRRSVDEKERLGVLPFCMHMRRCWRQGHGRPQRHNATLSRARPPGL